MALEDLLGPDVYWGALNRDWPLGTDPKSQGDDHLRGLKNVALNTNPRVNAAQDWSAAESNRIISTINAMLAESVGVVQAWSLAPPAAGWIVCDGAAVSRTAFPLLFAYLGTAFGIGDGTTTFNVPDYRGKFLRSQTAGSGNDPDVNGRTDRGDGVVGDAPGTQQASANLTHTHLTNSGANLNPDTGQNVATANPGLANNCARSTFFNPHTHASQTSGAEGGSDARPINVYVVYAIRSDAVALTIQPEDDPV